MLYHIITTPECNLCCVYCGEKAFSEPPTPKDNLFEPTPISPQYSIKELFDFLKKDSTEVSLIFYGGEPLLNIDFVKEIIDYNKKEKVVKNFLLQTNATLLHTLPIEYTNSFHTILVSIDGPKKTTDMNRGTNTYEKIISNLNLIRNNGFDGEIIARMTIEEPTNFFEDVSFLIKNNAFPFSSIHWQLDANMWHDYEKRNFSEWIKEYNTGIKRLISLWLSEMEKGNVLRLYPFLGIVNSLLTKTNYHLRCGSGIGNFTILTNGHISACPIMSGVKKNYLGGISKTLPQTLPFSLTIKGLCNSCDYFYLCGGRCLYSNLYPCWPKKGINEICSSIKYLIDELQKSLPKIELLIEKNIIKKEDFDFLKYNCCEIIP